ncbi:CPBP family intramembrane glutamic endopeptidase [Desulfosporosinus sp. FKA]|uniref:CPBP family intramembrane glutamic endopeptidase n=1 Tax=Desulfosporosinus sp. FKA TaxID=1969834 RepID=UPI00249DD5B8|nr:CPBP family intramembrane glutamic endopeptidase [Desulfosporosinus sp. FKA]
MTAFLLLKNQLPHYFLVQLNSAAILEEPLFRGFFWGYLKNRGWKESWIWLTQAGLFVIGHIYYINKAPLSFWIIVPLSGLVLGFLVWRTRTIATSMVAHGLINSVADLSSNYTV